MRDSLVTMFDDIRAERPPIYDAARWGEWIAALRQVIQQLPTYDQRWASVALVADDLAGAMGMPLACAYRGLAPLLLDDNDRQRVGVEKGGAQ